MAVWMRRAFILFRDLCIATAVLLAVITFTPLVGSVAGDMATDWYEGDGNVLVVLGGSMLVSGTGPRAAPGCDTYLRTVYAAWVLHSHTYSWVVVSGGHGLAQAMKESLVRAGVAAQSILEERESESTFENAMYVKDLLQRRDLMAGRIVVLTSDYHSWRARRVFDKFGMHVRVIPVPDVGKRAASWTYRWQGFFTLLNEFGKDAAYAAMGRL